VALLGDAYTEEGAVRGDWGTSAELRKGYRTDEVRSFSHIFRRLHRDKPSITLVPGHNAFPIHPRLDPAFTVREAARIQTVGDETEFRLFVELSG
jgi:DNA (cytosine-5)-methyltransferase 1